MKCFECGAQIREEARFCPYCGKDQSQRPVESLCPHCGQPLIPGARFCGFCGGDQTKQPQNAPLEEPVVVEETIPAAEIPAEEPVCVQESQCVDEPAVAEETVEQEPELELVEEAEPIAAEPEEEEHALEEIPAESIPEPEPEPEPQPEPEPAPQPEPAPVPAAEPKSAPVAAAPVAPPVAPPVAAPAPTQIPAHAPAQPPVQYQYTPYQQAPVYQSQPVITPVAQPVVQPVYQAIQVRPAMQLPTGRALWKMILLSVLTLGIYPLVIWCKMSMEINVVASRHDGQWTMHYMCMLMLAPLTLMIYPLVWIHGLCNRTGDELIRRKVNYKFSAATFWLWNLLYPLLGGAITAALIFILPTFKLSTMIVYIAAAATGVISLIGPFVYLHKHMKAMNLMNADYNQKG